MDYDHLILQLGGQRAEDDNLHPVDYLRKIGLTYTKASPNSYQECWHLYGVRNAPDPLPKWFTVGK